MVSPQYSRCSSDLDDDTTNQVNFFFFIKLENDCYSCEYYNFSTEIRGGFMVKQIEFSKLSMRCNIMEGNQYAANAAAAYGFDV